MVIALALGMLVPGIRSAIKHKEVAGKEDSTHDKMLDDDGIFGYTAADFEKAILTDSEQLKKLEVYKAELSDVTTITDTGVFDLPIFSKYQILKYYGTATYTVDLSELSKKNISVDKKQNMVTLTIPSPKCEEVNIPRDKIEYGEILEGHLAFGEIKVTPEQMNEVELEAKKKMEEKLEEDEVQKTAERFAKLSVWEMYQPIVSKVSKACQLEVKIQETDGKKDTQEDT